jgi:hypothetical protein
VQLLESSFTAAQAENSDREIVEFINFLNIYLATSSLEQSTTQSRIIDNAQRVFPNINLIEAQVRSIIEISPPIYDYQKSLMLRVFNTDGNSVHLTQYELPYSVEMVELFINLLKKKKTLFQQKSINTQLEKENEILNNPFYSELDIAPEEILRMYPIFQEDVDIQTFSQVDSIVNPELDATIEVLENAGFFEQFIQTLTQTCSDIDRLERQAKYYRDVLTTTAGSLDVSNLEKNSAARKVLQDLSLLREVVNGGDVNNFISTRTQGEANSVSFELSGDCPSDNVTIGGSQQISPTIARAATSDEISSVTNLFGNDIKDVEIMSVEGGKYKLKTFTDSSGKKKMVCPICQKGVFDLNGSESTCSECNNTSESLREAWECRDWSKFNQLSKIYNTQGSESNNIFGIFASIIESIFGLSF